MATALSIRDIGAMYRLLHAHGVTYQTIATIARHHPSEVHDIVNGRRVNRYDTLSRIADSFGIRRGRMGLAASYPDGGSTAETQTQDDDLNRRELLALAASAAAGASLPAWLPGWTGDGTPLPLPSRVGMSDVAHVEALRATLGSLNERYGSAAQHDAALALWQRADRLLSADMADSTRRKLLAACARLATTVGWSSADLGDNNAAGRQFDHALTYADAAGDTTGMARALAFAGRSELCWGGPNHAARLFEFGRIAAERARSRLLCATIDIHAAQAATVAGWDGYAATLTARAADEYAAVGADDPASRYPFGDIASARAAVRLAHGDTDGAVADMRTAQAQAEGERVRSQAFRQARTATVLLAAGDRDGGVAAGRDALTAARAVRSQRVARRLAPIAAYADRYADHDADARELAADVRAVAV